jgi:uncharacterized protein YoxC
MASRDARALIGDLIGLPFALTRSALLVPEMVVRASKIMDDIAGIVAAAEELLGVVNATLTRIAKTADAAAALPNRVAQVIEQTEHLPHRVIQVIEQSEHLPRRVAEVIEQSEHLPGRAVVVIERAVGVFDSATHLVSEIDGMPERLRPLVEALSDLDPGVATQLGHLIPTIGPLLSRLEDEVIPSVASLQSLVPVVELLHLNVGELQSVVAEVGKLIGSVPGASLLRRRAEREP